MCSPIRPALLNRPSVAIPSLSPEKMADRRKPPKRTGHESLGWQVIWPAAIQFYRKGHYIIFGKFLRRAAVFEFR